MKNQKVYQRLSSLINARLNCIESGNDEWFDKHDDAIDYIVDNNLPSGSGVDSGCEIDKDKHEVLNITSSYHTMDENGYYGPWVDFTVKVKPSLQFGIDLAITGPFAKHFGLKDYLYDLFDYALNEIV